MESQIEAHENKHTRRHRINVAWARNAPSTISLTTQHPYNTVLLRNRALDVLFGLPPSHLTEWGGLLAFFHHLETCFGELLEPQFNFLWKLLNHEKPSNPNDVWIWCFAVLDAYESSPNQDLSIEKIYRAIWDKAYQRMISDEAIHLPTEEDKKYILQAIFAVVCWLSSTLKPVIGEKMTGLSQSLFDRSSLDEDDVISPTSTIIVAENCSQLYYSTDLQRPTEKMINSFRPRISERDDQHAKLLGLTSSRIATEMFGGNFEDRLYQPSLDYGSLSAFARVRIKWVDTLTAHLAFDRATRELSIYLYPSFCVAKILSKHKLNILERVTEKLLPPQISTDSSIELASIYREVLLSYRILFGQSSRSRQILSQILSRLPSNSEDGTQAKEAHQKEKIDQFLHTLCTSPLHAERRFMGIPLGRKSRPAIKGDLFPQFSLNIHNELIESDTYSALEDFPTFGPRLLALQRYNMRHQPSKVTDLWRDRRNPLQWYTFWAVIWIGGIGILLSTLQLVIGVLQVVYAIRPVS